MRVSVMELGRFTAGTGRQRRVEKAGSTSLSSTRKREAMKQSRAVVDHVRNRLTAEDYEGARKALVGQGYPS